jgi:DNA-binding NarL/FixJ family response regulator
MLTLISGRNSAPPLRVLVLHDCAVSAERLTRELELGGTKLLSHRVDSEGAFLQALRNFAPDVVLATSTLTNFNARTALQLVQAHHPIAAVILITATFDEQCAVACLQAGVETVVLENNLRRLGPAIQEALLVRQPLRRVSRRQLQILRSVTEGLTSKEIAAGLGLSVKTVESHRSAGMRRLGLDKVAGLVLYAVRAGLIPQGLPHGANGGNIRRVAALTPSSASVRGRPTRGEPYPAQSRGSNIASSSASKEPG